MRQRITYFDFLRGAAILMVVAIHTYPNDGFATPLATTQMLGRQLIGCAVPVFLAISGFFLAHKALDTREERFAFWRRQIPKIYIPCLVWSIPFFALSLAGMESFSLGGVALRTVYTLLGGCSIYYFIALIIQCYLLLPWLRTVNRGANSVCPTQLRVGRGS